MNLKYNIDINPTSVKKALEKLVNETYKLLPNREEGIDWQKPLDTIMEELAGMSRLFTSHRTTFFTILCKLEGLYTLKKEQDFFLFRRTIFECLNLMGVLIKHVNKEFKD